jgi:hypothetical protein
MAKLTGTKHGDAANDLQAFYQDRVHELEESGQYFMAAIALAFALETAILTYLLVEFGEDNGGELQIPDSVGMSDLIDAANEIDVLTAPIDAAIDGGETLPKHIGRDAASKIQKFRKLIHPARALTEFYDPRTFTRREFEEYKEMYRSVMHSLLYYL